MVYVLVNRYFTRLPPAATLFLVAAAEPMAVVFRTVWRGFWLERRGRRGREESEGLDKNWRVIVRGCLFEDLFMLW